MNVCKRQIRVPTSAVMCLAASGACVHLELCCLGMGAPVRGWKEGRPLLTAPESGQDSAHSWCHPSAGQSSPDLTEYLALPDRAVLLGIPTEMAHVLVSFNKSYSPNRCDIGK